MRHLSRDSSRSGERNAVYYFPLENTVLARFTTTVTAVGTAILAAWLYTSRPPSPSFLATPYGPLMVAADLDGRGGLDRAVLQGDAVAVTLSEPNAEVVLAAPDDTTALAAGDIDRDGDLDLVSLGRDGLRAWINRGSGSFTASIAVRSAKPVLSLAMQALRWSDMGPALPPLVTVRAASDGLVPGPVAAVAAPTRTTALDTSADRAPPQTAVSSSSPRAPPQTVSA